MRTLTLAAVAEAGTLLVLLLNVVTTHMSAITDIVGPIHGTAYLMVIVATLLHPSAPPRARWLSVVPGLGGLFAVRHVSSEQRRHEHRPPPGSIRD